MTLSLLMTMADHITIDQIQTKDSFNLVTLFNEANQCENENGNDSPFTSQKNIVIIIHQMNFLNYLITTI